MLRARRDGGPRACGGRGLRHRRGRARGAAGQHLPAVQPDRGRGAPGRRGPGLVHLPPARRPDGRRYPGRPRGRDRHALHLRDPPVRRAAARIRGRRGGRGGGSPRAAGSTSSSPTTTPPTGLVAETLCEMFGCTSESVEDGLQAVAAATSGRFDLVLMDIKMPELDGVGATRRIRALPGAVADIPILALTANADPWDAASYLAQGMNGVVEKADQGRAADRRHQPAVRRRAPRGGLGRDHHAVRRARGRAVVDRFDIVAVRGRRRRRRSSRGGSCARRDRRCRGRRRPGPRHGSGRPSRGPGPGRPGAHGRTAPPHPPTARRPRNGPGPPRAARRSPSSPPCRSAWTPRGHAPAGARGRSIGRDEIP